MPLLERGVAAEGLDSGGGGGAEGLLLELIGIDFVAELHKARLHVLDCGAPHSLNDRFHANPFYIGIRTTAR